MIKSKQNVKKRLRAKMFLIVIPCFFFSKLFHHVLIKTGCCIKLGFWHSLCQFSPENNKNIYYWFANSSRKSGYLEPTIHFLDKLMVFSPRSWTPASVRKMGVTSVSVTRLKICIWSPETIFPIVITAICRMQPLFSQEERGNFFSWEIMQCSRTVDFDTYRQIF